MDDEMRTLKCIKGSQTATSRAILELPAAFALYLSTDAACFAVRTTGK